MRWLVAVILTASVAACSLFSSGGGASAPGLPPDASSAQVTADEVLQGLTTAWNAAATVCLDAENAGVVKDGSCAAVLLPAHDALLTAASAIDAWNAGANSNFPCAVSAIVAGLVDTEKLLTDAKVTVPPAIQTGLSLAQGVAAFCPPSSGYVSKDAPGAPLPTFDAGT